MGCLEGRPQLVFCCGARVATGGLGQVEQRETRRSAGSPPGSLSVIFKSALADSDT